jgi:integrase
MVATFAELAKRWTSGELARLHPDHVREKRSADDDAAGLDRYVFPVLGAIPLDLIKLADCERVMTSLAHTKRRLSSATRRQVAQTIHRVLKLAVYPARLIPASPLPEGFMPRVTCAKALTYLYPSEDRTLLRHTAAPLPLRVFFGFLAREGLREGEALSLTWEDLDLDHGAVTLDQNKTNDPRSWALDSGVRLAMRAWRDRYRSDASPSERVFVDAEGAPLDAFGLPEQLRTWLRDAGIDRAALYERSEVRQPMRVHDLRSTFVTVSLANGKTEAWVSDRTGHKSSVMINRYRRAARTVAELGLGGLAPMNEAIPELSGPTETRPQGRGGNGSPTSRPTSRTRRASTRKPLENPSAQGRNRTNHTRIFRT